MAKASQKQPPQARPATARPGAPLILLKARRLIFLFSFLCCAGAVRASDPHSAFLDKQFAPSPPEASVTVTAQVAEVNGKVADLEAALTQQVQMMAQGPQVAAPPRNYDSLALALSLLLFATAAILKMAPLLKVRFNTWFMAPAEPAGRWVSLLEEPSKVEFFKVLRASLAGPLAEPAVEPPGSRFCARAQMSEEASCAAADPFDRFFDAAPRQLASLRAQLPEINRAPGDAARTRILLEFFHLVRLLKENSRLPALLPFWQMTFALEGLLKQLSSKASNITPSALRTLAGAVDLLEGLCARSLNPHIATEPPVRLLAVDDDAVSRRAISFALKKAFHEPDLAPDGQAGLALAARQAYDVIFLDVEMPGMDGFELCSKIHQTGLNRTTPVVFVTGHSDFGSRAKSTLSGGHDLIAKPFLAFEITVKALTLVMRARLSNGGAGARSGKEAAVPPAQVEAADTSSAPAPIAPSESPASAVALPRAELGISEAGHSSGDLGGRNFAASYELARNELADATFAHAAARVEGLRDLLQAARHTAEPACLGTLMGQLWDGVRLLNSEAEGAQLGAVLRLGSALEGMLKKLLEHSNLCTPDTLNAAASALELLEELCLAGSNPDLANPPIRLLVADDDPVARRAISGSLQLAFGRPDCADSGEAALALAAEKPFDLIFLDVLMPGMDGFTACAKIHETAQNSRTPVAFIANATDRDSRSQAAVAGGCALLSKPVLPSHINLTALTLILRARLDKVELTHTREEVAGGAMA